MPWQPSYASAAELATWLNVENTGAELALATEAASRAIDQACNRQFGHDTAARLYTPYLHRDRYWVDVDDVVGDDVVIETLDETGNPVDTITDFILTPRNATADGRPYSRIELSRGVTATDPLRITATWGWSAIPGAVKLACLTQAGRFYGRRESPAGPLTSHVVDDVRRGWAAGKQELDADVAAAIAPYRRLWSAA